MTKTSKYSFGWLPDYPDIRDYTEENLELKPLLVKLNFKKSKTPLPPKNDLRKWCSPIENQQNLGSCTANAVAAVVEYFENKSFGKYIDSSRLFLYKTTRNLLRYTGDSGAFLKSTLGALVLFGMPPEEYWPYDTAIFDEEPNAFCYAFAQNYRCISYFRHDPPKTSKSDVLIRIKKYLNSGVPSIFGFTVYQSMQSVDKTGKIPYPSGNEKILGGHAVAAMGYDDTIKIKNQAGKTTTGAILIRNSWGEEWGENGYGWLPYEYILQGIAIDWWSVLKQDWVDTGAFLGEG
jgi:C1A family cysteine protease